MDHGWSAETDRPDESGTPFGEAVPPGVAATVPDAAPAWGASVSGATENDGPEGAGGGCKVRAESREPRAESREPRAESREPRAESPRAESREPRAESREPRAESREPRAESREPRAESREPRAELRPQCAGACRVPRPEAAPAGAGRLAESREPRASPAAPAARDGGGPPRAFPSAASAGRGFRAASRSTPQPPGGGPARRHVSRAALARRSCPPRSPRAPARQRRRCREVGRAIRLNGSSPTRRLGHRRRASEAVGNSSPREPDGKRNLHATSRGDYNSFVQARAAAVARQHPALRIEVPGFRQHERGRCPRQHGHHRHGRADLLAERQQGRRPQCRTSTTAAGTTKPDPKSNRAATFLPSVIRLQDQARITEPHGSAQPVRQQREPVTAGEVQGGLSPFNGTAR